MIKLLRAYFLMKARTIVKPCQHFWEDKINFINKDNPDCIIGKKCRCKKCGMWKTFKL